METYFIEIKHPNGATEEIKRKAENQVEVVFLVKNEFPDAEIITCKTLLLD